MKHPDRLRREALALCASGLPCRTVTGRLRETQGVVVSPQTVAKWAREVGKGRRRGPQRISVPAITASRWYESGLSVAEIASRLGVGETTIYDRLGEVHTRMRPSRIRYAHVLTEERLRSLYLEQGRPVASIAGQFGCAPGTVYNWLERYGIRLKEGHPSGPERGQRAL